MRRIRCVIFALLAVGTTACAEHDAPRVNTLELEPWPGVDDVRTVDVQGSFAGNMSGLVYDVDDPTAPTVLWAVRNYPGTLFRLVPIAGLWRPDTVGPWRTGRRLRFADGRGDVDAEGLALVGRAVYVASERDNDDDAVSRNMILRFDPATADDPLRPTHQWDITADLPSVAPNKGIEAIAFVPDAHLVDAGFIDARTRAPYDPTRDADHGGGLYIVGLETDGALYVFALDHRTQRAVRVAVVPSGLPSVMALDYDVDTRTLWAHCDDACHNTSALLAVNERGVLSVVRRYAPPTSLPDVNNEGLTIAPLRACRNRQRPIVWADDSETGGHALRASTVPCTPTR